MAAGLGMFELGTLAPPFLIGGNCIYLIEKINFTYVTDPGLLIGRECVVRVPSLATYHQLEFRELLIREDLLLVNTAAVLLSLLVEAFAVEALIAASFTHVIGIPARVLREVVNGCGRLKHVVGRGHRFGETLWPRCDLTHVVVRLLVLLSQLLEELVLQDLRGSVTFVRVVDQHLHDDILGIGRNMRYELSYTDELLGLEVELHVSCVLLKLIQELLRRGPHDVVNFIYLVKLIISRKQGEE